LNSKSTEFIKEGSDVGSALFNFLVLLPSDLLGVTVGERISYIVYNLVVRHFVVSGCLELTLKVLGSLSTNT